MSDEITQCPFCGEDIGINDVKCKHCDEVLKEEQKDLYEETKICPFCGEEILAVALKCKHCGEFLDKSASEKQNKQDELYVPKNPDDADKRTSYNVSGPKEKKALPEELKHFNWGAFFGTWIWGLGNETYIALLAIPIGLIGLIPIIGWGINLAFCIFLGIKGNEWAWQNKKWSGPEQFNDVQRVWATVFIILWCVFVLPFIIYCTVNFMIGFAEGVAEGLSEL